MCKTSVCVVDAKLECSEGVRYLSETECGDITLCTLLPLACIPHLPAATVIATVFIVIATVFIVVDVVSIATAIVSSITYPGTVYVCVIIRSCEGFG
jgi:hypothetical protein